MVTKEQVQKQLDYHDDLVIWFINNVSIGDRVLFSGSRSNRDPKFLHREILEIHDLGRKYSLNYNNPDYIKMDFKSNKRFGPDWQKEYEEYIKVYKATYSEHQRTPYILLQSQQNMFDIVSKNVYNDQRHEVVVATNSISSLSKIKIYVDSVDTWYSVKELTKNYVRHD